LVLITLAAEPLANLFLVRWLLNIAERIGADGCDANPSGIAGQTPRDP
jgi:hypothetical protein